MDEETDKSSGGEEEEREVEVIQWGKSDGTCVRRTCWGPGVPPVSRLPT